MASPAYSEGDRGDAMSRGRYVGWLMDTGRSPDWLLGEYRSNDCNAMKHDLFLFHNYSDFDAIANVITLKIY
jgi:hypothetical protein